MKTKLAVALVASCAPLAVVATELSHDYIEAGIARRSENVPAWAGPDRDFDGGYVRGSVAVSPNFYVFGHLARDASDGPGFELEATELGAGIGYNHAVGAATEVVTELGYVRRELDDFDHDVTGERLSAGVRHAFGDRVEGWAKAHYTNGFSRERYSGEVGALYRLGSTWGVTGEVDVEADSNRYSLGLRASF